jgi:hypothetical protein
MTGLSLNWMRCISAFFLLEDVKGTIRLLGILILAHLYNSPEVVGEFMSLDPGEVQCLLLDLASVVECVDKKTEIRMLHASFPDFLLDRSRSLEYYIDSSMMHADIAQLYLSHVGVHDSKQCEISMFLAPSVAYPLPSCILTSRT